MKAISLLPAVMLGLAAAAAAAGPAEAPAAKAPVGSAATAAEAPTQAAAGSELYFIAPADGATVERVFAVKFGLRGMGVAPAGTLREGTGHHHLLIDVKEAPKAGEAIPNDPHHLHFGSGQTETMLALPSGDHTLQLVLGDASHRVFDPPLLSERITVHVK